MNYPDLINGTFEACGMFFILLSIIKLGREKKVRGVSWIHVGFFATWGYWNLYYYPHLNQWMSFFGGLGIVITNTWWLAQLIYYTNKERKIHGL
jgi:hypothetical protein